ncbi:MAG: hypothetical protein M5U28_46450 [Sandaracinaceae bacterium]|nr:hypothetical protein [Sandaracinaceae bacterium]
MRQRYRHDGSNAHGQQTLDQDTTVCGGARSRPTSASRPPSTPATSSAAGSCGVDAVRGRRLARDRDAHHVAGARTVRRSGSALSGYDREHRLTVALTDLIQTTAAVLDVRTGELLEASTYYPNGARDVSR